VVADALLGKNVKGLEDVPSPNADPQTYQLVISFARKRILAQQTLAYTLLELDRPDEALALLASIEKEHSERADPSGHREKSNTQLSEELAPFSAIQTAWARFWLGNVCVILGSPRKALEPLHAAELPAEKAADMIPDTLFSADWIRLHNATVELALFVCYTKLGRKNEAREHLKAALSISPWFFGAGTQTVFNILTIDPLPEELPESVEANAPAYSYLIAVTLLAQNENDKAQSFLRAAISNGKNPWPFYPANAELTALKRTTPGF
jgi:tetratricopeptide (TPR) repeat protein